MIISQHVSVTQNTIDMSLEKTLKKCFKLISEEKLEEAISFCESALEIYHDQADLISCKGEAKFKLGHKQKALKDFNVAVDLEPNNPYRYSSRAYIKDSMGDLKGAIADYQKAIELDPGDAVALNNLGLLEEKLGYQTSAKTNFQKADSLLEEFPELKSDIINPIQDKLENSKPDNYLNTIFKVFKDRKTRNEFLDFVKNGLRFK